MVRFRNPYAMCGKMESNTIKPFVGSHVAAFVIVGLNSFNLLPARMMNYLIQ